MKHFLELEDRILQLIAPETDLEIQLLREPTFQKGLLWGEPRYGHPEGKIILHIREVFDNIDKLNLCTKERAQLRLVALVHDTFKYKEDRSFPRDWARHHAMLAREYMEQYNNDEVVLNILELHDEAYYCWRMFNNVQMHVAAQIRLESLINRVHEYLQLYYLFFKCDTQTGDKTQVPVEWFESTVKDINIINF